MRYKILWIDDEYKRQEDFIGAAEQEDLDVIPFESHEEGIGELEANPGYHAVILDAKVKHKKSDTVSNLNGLRASRDFLIEYNKSNYLPYFIFTGQPDYTTNEMFQQSFGKYFIKGNDNEALFKAVLQSQTDRPEIQARKDFAESFKAFDKGILGKKEKKIFLEIIDSFEEKDYRKKNINTQRDFLEAIFISLNNPIPCIPPGLFNNNKPNQEWCTRFLENRPTKDGNGNEHRLNENIPKDIKAAFRKLKESTNQYSHLNDEEVVKFPFLSNFYLIMEILCWLPEFVDEHYENYV
ncbi:hypothetical protein [Salegentibacter sp. Hel_I_6]|uniref:hypothetical protein n=1 Tax=Salegentibacter sp. Hel_I_6 TaxID=1250278 RepID=UPI0005649F0B|nr:hypothetical protein [Salegentibacter sp. Hel_I_6]